MLLNICILDMFFMTIIHYNDTQSFYVQLFRKYFISDIVLITITTVKSLLSQWFFGVNLMIK